MSAEAPHLPLVSTGIPELDRILGGGIPEQSVTMIAGEPGAGKTILTLQMLFNAARQGRKCIYFTTLSEPAIKVIRYMQTFSFCDVAQLDERIVFIDLGSVIRQGAEETLAEVSKRVENLQPYLVAIDSFRSIGELLRQPGAVRPFVYDLAIQMAGWGATTLLVGEYRRRDILTYAEFAVADGIIRLGSRRQGLTSVRGIEVHKLRGSAYLQGLHFFDVTRDGLQVYPRVSAPKNATAGPRSTERDATGIAGLDALLEGGLPRAGATVVQGPTGSGKTVIALHYLMAAVQRSERAVLFTMEETPDQLRGIAEGFGWDLAAAEKAGLLAIRYVSPVELSTDKFLHEARAEVEHLQASRAVFDSLTTLALGVPSTRRFQQLVYAIAKHMRGLDCSLLMTMEAQQTIGVANISGLGISFIADTLIQLRYLELDGRLERALSVIKARGIAVNTEVRGATIGRGGMTVVADRFKDMRGVMTGLPSDR